MHGYILIDDALQVKGIYIVSRCFLCGIVEGKTNHLFLQHNFSAFIWLSSFFRRPIRKNEGVRNMLLHSSERWCGTQLFSVCNVVILSIL